MIAYLLIWQVGTFDLRVIGDVVAAGLGMLMICLFSARHFGRFHGGDCAKRP